MARTKHGLPGVYNSTAITLSDEEGAALAIDTKARVITAPAVTPNGDSLIDDTVDAYKATQATGLSKTIDSVTARPEGTSATNMTASAVVRTGTGILVGMYVNSTSTGTIKLWDNTAASGTVLNNTITPAIGYHSLGNAIFSTGLYATIANTLDVTLYFIPTP